MQFSTPQNPILSKSGDFEQDAVDAASAASDDDADDADIADDDQDYDDSVDGDDDGDSNYNYDAVNYAALCNELKNANLTPKADGESIIKFRGEGSFSMDHLNRAHKVRGKIALIGQSDSSDIQVIHRFRGQMLICYADVARLKKVRGDVIVVDGNVGDVSKFRGNLILVGGKIIGKVSHSRRAHIIVK